MCRDVSDLSRMRNLVLELRVSLEVLEQQIPIESVQLADQISAIAEGLQKLLLMLDEDEKRKTERVTITKFT
ncbi:hypothetical protein FOI68_13685 [Brevibacillus sp. LEMMJ03]|uniref:hypothetical protein n=1 Tax=Brevibacillus sp. LEMMJ03 TaxID=2595056 RepID=UPI00117D70D2|nr:hypothetical protein [Brevibacillus sp. LEMMJ03]TRY24964.1 hypothetical protein FOI68_13685 [Brevibacillus sp. LEMMJ03]